MTATTTTTTTTTTMTMTAATVTPTVTLSATPCCPQCGFDVGLPPLEETQTALLDAQQQIADLQAQVRLLNQKASAAVDRWADYEDDLAKLRAELEASRATPNQSSSPTASTAPTASTPGPTPLPTPSTSSSGSSAAWASPARSSFLPSGAASRLSALLSPRRSTPNLKPLPAPPPPLPSPHHQLRHYGSSHFPLGPAMSHPQPLPSPSPSADDLLEALTREQALRLEAEGRLSDTSREVEELSVSLFEQANEMVAAERRARARLEERVETLERRDVDKRRRLERLEGAMERIERVRSLLGEVGPVAVMSPVSISVPSGAGGGAVAVAV